MKINVIYARVSTEDKQDFDRQVTELKQRVLTYGNGEETKIEVISEKISGYKLQNGSKLETFLQEVEKEPNKYEMLYVWELSRLGRNPLETRNRIELLLRNGINIYVETLRTVLSDNNEGMSNAMTKMILLLLLEFSHIEAQTTKLRIKSGLLQSARSGKVGGGKHIPYGFRKDENKNLVICDEEKKIIERIFNLYKEGFGIRKISTILNNDKTPTRYNKVHGEKLIKFKNRSIVASEIKWSDKQIHDILMNSLYIGERKFKGEIIKCPAIIDKETFNFCQNLRVNKNSKSDTKHIFLLKDILKCKCGRNFVGVNKKDEKVYKCSSRLKTNSSCGSLGINIKLIESVIFHNILISSHLVNFVRSNKDIKNGIVSEIKILNSEIENQKLKNKLLIKNQYKLLDDSIAGNFPEEVIRKKSEDLNKEIEKNQSKIDSIELNLINKNNVLKEKSETNYELIYNSKNDRGILRKLFSEIIKTVQIVEFNQKYIILDLSIRVFDRNEIIFRLRLETTNIKRKVKKYIYIVESATINVFHNGIVCPLYFNRKDYIDLSSIDFNIKQREMSSFREENKPSSTIFIDNIIVSESDFLYDMDSDENNVFSILKLMFIERFSTYFVFPVELKDDQLVTI